SMTVSWRASLDPVGSAPTAAIRPSRTETDPCTMSSASFMVTMVALRIRVEVDNGDSAAHVLDQPGFDSWQRFEEQSHERQKMLHTIRSRQQDDDAERQNRKLVLPLELPIHRHEGVDLSRGTAQQIAVLHARPAEPLDSAYVESSQLGDQIVWQDFI